VDSLAGAGDLEWVHDTGYFYRQADGSLKPSDNAIVDAPHEHPNILPIRGFHDQMPVLGFRFGDIAYITDMSSIPESEFVKLQGLEHLTLNTVSYHPHHSHFSLEEALQLAHRIGAKHTWLTHLSHAFPQHKKFCADLEKICTERGINSIVQPAYDGLTITA
jgi:phosphoribosyl 1,2-cyclic phosphate phosphodiesterase